MQFLGGNVRADEHLAERAVIGVSVPSQDVAVVYTVMFAVATSKLHRLGVTMHMEAFDSHLQRHHHQQKDGEEAPACVVASFHREGRIGQLLSDTHFVVQK